MILQIRNAADHYLNEKFKKKNKCIDGRWIRWKIWTEFATLRTRTHIYLTDDNDENKKQKAQTMHGQTKTYIWR